MDLSQLSPEELARIRGSVVIRNVSGDDRTLINLGGHVLADDAEIDLLDPDTPDHLRAHNFPTAILMTSDTATELGAAVAAGEISVATVQPDITILRQRGAL